MPRGNQKRSVVLFGQKTSVSLEDDFWNSLALLAQQRGQKIGHIVETIKDNDGEHPQNLSSAIRLHVLHSYMAGELPQIPAFKVRTKRSG